MGHLSDISSNGKKVTVKSGNKTAGTYSNGTYVKNTSSPSPTQKTQTVSTPSYSPVVSSGGSPSSTTVLERPYDNEDSYSARDNYEDIMSYFQAQQAAALAAQQAAIQAGRDQAVNTLNQQKETTGNEYANLYRQLYIDSMKSKKNLDQTLALQGLTGGMSESAILDVDNTYAENLASGKAKEQAAYNDIANSISNAQLAASADEATAIANTAKENATNYLSAMQNLINLEATERANRINAANSQASENRQYAYNYALALLNAGQMPSSELLSSAGISSADAASLISGKTTTKSSGGTSTSSGTKSSSNYSNAGYVYTDAMTMARGGNKSKALSYLSDAYNDGLISNAQYIQYKTAISNNY